MNLFEQALRRRASCDDDARILLAQWEFERILVGQALQSVQMLFGHYSRHDASHSETILTQVSRVLGHARVQMLSATDLWLMLSAAYHHDIGMVIPDAEAREWWSDGALRAHLEELLDHEDPEYRVAAQTLIDSPAALTGNDWPFEVKRRLLLVLADYARKRHPSRAEQIVGQPARIGLSTPRVIIPLRLFALLGKICAAHGTSFREAMKLVHAEQGLGMDDAHPRFVAMMLRLGDLLDLDSGRFCPIMNAAFGVLPVSSDAHRRKHASIEHLLVQAHRIEVDAVCFDEWAFDEAERWLDWLRSEIRNQAACWLDIAPSSDFGALPSLGEVQARLPNQILFDGRRPRFEVDRESVLDLMRGTNVYEDKYAAIRELLQNAVDATIFRVWVSHEQAVRKADAEAHADPNVDPRDHLREILAKYPIDVRLARVTPGSEKGDPTTIRWQLSITDRGTGIDEDDVVYLQSIGASRKNPRRRAQKRQMPEWLKPSGIFGIGLQSCFLLTDRVEIVSATRSRRPIRIELRRETDKQRGGLVATSVVDDMALVDGTRVSLELDVDRVPSRVTMSSRDDEVRQILATFDPIADKEMPYEVAMIRASVRRFAETAALPMWLDGQQLPQGDEALFASFDSRSRKRWFDASTGVAIRFAAAKHGRTRSFYRGVEFELNWHLRYVNMDVDFRFGEARDLLQLSREKPTAAGSEALVERLDSAFGRAIPAYLEELIGAPATPPKERLAASFLAQWQPCAEAFRDRLPEWRQEVCLGDISDSGLPTFDELLKLNEFWVSIPNYRGEDESPSWNGNDSRLDSAGAQTDELFHLLWQNGRFARLDRIEVETASTPPRFSRRTETYLWSKDPKIDPLSDQALVSILKDAGRSISVGGRAAIPCPNEFAMLGIEPESFSGTWISSRAASIKGKKMVLPFFYTGKGEASYEVSIPYPRELVAWVASRSTRPSEAIAEEYVRFTKRFDELLRDHWREHKTYDLVAACAGFTQRSP